MTTLLSVSRIWWPHFCIRVDDHIFVCEQMIILLSVSRWPHLICAQKPTFCRCATSSQFFLCCRWPQLCLCADGHAFIFVQISLCRWPHFICVQITTLISVWQVIGYDKDYQTFHIATKLYSTKCNALISALVDPSESFSTHLNPSLPISRDLCL